VAVFRHPSTESISSYMVIYNETRYYWAAPSEKSQRQVVGVRVSKEAAAPAMIFMPIGHAARSCAAWIALKGREPSPGSPFGLGRLAPDLGKAF